MAWYIDTWRDRYPRTIDFLSGDFVNLTRNNAKIWDAFLATAQLNSEDALGVIQFVTVSTSPPLIWFKELGGLAGFFEKDHGARILINAEIARQFEAASSDNMARSYVQAKVLHEMVHWSLFNHGDLEPSSVEMGVQFENRAYDAPPSPFWLAAPARALPAAPPSPADVDHGTAESLTGGAGFDTPQVAVGLPRGIRNNNPGNIKKSDVQWEGLADPAEMTDYQHQETVFCVFRAPSWGLRAMARILYNYQQQHRLLTVEAMIGRWAPPGDNNKTDAYIDFVSQRMGIGRAQAFDFRTAGYAVPMIQAMVRMENGIQPYATDQIQQAHGMAIV